MTLRVLLVDDQPLIRVGFTAILRSQPDLEVVGEAGDGEDALRLAAETDPDVICMDVQMPRLDGVEATRRLVAGGTRAAVLILTTFDTDEALFAALTAGAAGFLLKSAGPEELIEAVRVLGRGDALLDPQVTRRVLQRMTAGAGAAPPPADAAPAGPAPADPAPADPLPAGPARGVGSGAGAGDGVGLTAREAEVLRAMARGLSNGEIARELFVGEATVKTHVSNVLLKTGARDRVHAVIWAFQRGMAG